MILNLLTLVYDDNESVYIPPATNIMGLLALTITVIIVDLTPEALHMPASHPEQYAAMPIPWL